MSDSRERRFSFGRSQALSHREQVHRRLVLVVPHGRGPGQVGRDLDLLVPVGVTQAPGPASCRIRFLQLVGLV